MCCSSLLTSTADARSSARSTAGEALESRTSGGRSSDWAPLRRVRARSVAVARSAPRSRPETGRRAGCRRATGRPPALRRTCCCAGTRRGTAPLCRRGAPERPQLVEDDAPGHDREQSEDEENGRAKSGRAGDQTEDAECRNLRTQLQPAPAAAGRAAGFQACANGLRDIAVRRWDSAMLPQNCIMAVK